MLGRISFLGNSTFESFEKEKRGTQTEGNLTNYLLMLEGNLLRSNDAYSLLAVKAVVP
jgi:hypothetical protein